MKGSKKYKLCYACWTHKYCFSLPPLKSVIKSQNTLGNNTFGIKKEKQKKPGTKENCCCVVSIVIFIKTSLFKEYVLLTGT